MSSRRRAVGPVPDEFATYEDAGEFWDTHDTADYLGILEPEDADVTLSRRTFEVRIDADVMPLLRQSARQRGTTASRLASELLRRQLSPTA